MAKSNKSPFPALDKDGLKWWAYDFWHGGKRYRGMICPFENVPRRLAVARFKELKAKLLLIGEAPRQRPLGKSPKQIFEDYAAYIETHLPATWRSYKYNRKYAEGFFGKLDTITREAIVKYQSMRLGQKAKGGQGYVSGTTVNRELNYCHAAFERAGIVPNPFHKFDKFAEPERTRYLTQDELKDLLAAAKKSSFSVLYDIIETAIVTGLRQRRIFDLHSDQIDFALGIIRLPETVKSSKGFNTVHLTQKTIDMFKARVEHVDPHNKWTMIF